MVAKNEGLTLEKLAQMLETQAQQLETLQHENTERLERLETLEHENAELRREVTARRVSSAYRDEVAEMRVSGTGQSVEPTPEADGVVSRRALLSKAGAAAVAAMAAGTLLYPREARANHYGPGIEVDYVRAHSDNNYAVYAVSGKGSRGASVSLATPITLIGRAWRAATRTGSGLGATARPVCGVKVTPACGAAQTGVGGRASTASTRARRATAS